MITRAAAHEKTLLTFLDKVGHGLGVQLTTAELTASGLSHRQVERALTALRRRGKIQISLNRYRLPPNSWVNRRTILVKE